MLSVPVQMFSSNSHLCCPQSHWFLILLMFPLHPSDSSVICCWYHFCLKITALCWHSGASLPFWSKMVPLTSPLKRISICGNSPKDRSCYSSLYCPFLWCLTFCSWNTTPKIVLWQNWYHSPSNKRAYQRISLFLSSAMVAAIDSHFFSNCFWLLIGIHNVTNSCFYVMQW